MSYCLKSQDWSALVMARKLMLQGVKSLDITLGAPEDSWDIKSLWKKAWEQALLETRFGRIGFVYDEANKMAHAFCLGSQNFEYKPKGGSRALKSPHYKLIQTQILKPMADLGWENSVEFRRIARKYIRSLKQSHVDTVIFLEPIFADEKIQKILQHLLGSQIKIITPLDFLEAEIPASQEISIRIKTFYPSEKTQNQVKRLLKKKVSISDIQVLN